jgi:hypothetical protein
VTAKTAEQEARELLKRMGILNAEHFSAGELVELANLISAVKYPQRSQGEHELHRTKMQCGCWTYFQRGTNMGVYSLLVHDSCTKDHELAVGPNTTPPGEEPVYIPPTVERKIVETQLDEPPAPHLSRN